MLQLYHSGAWKFLEKCSNFIFGILYPPWWLLQWDLLNSLKLSDAFMHWTNQHWFRQWLVVEQLAPSHYLNQCWDIINRTLRNKLQWNFNQNSYIFIQENAFENAVWKMAAILFQPHCVKTKSMISCTVWLSEVYAGIILCVCPANERWSYNVTSSLIG